MEHQPSAKYEPIDLQSLRGHYEREWAWDEEPPESHGWIKAPKGTYAAACRLLGIDEAGWPLRDAPDGTAR